MPRQMVPDNDRSRDTSRGSDAALDSSGLLLCKASRVRANVSATSLCRTPPVPAFTRSNEATMN